MQPQSTQRATFKPRVRRLGEGRYLVESQSKPGVGHPCTASSCNCPGFAYRGLCRHVKLVRAIEPPMRRWYGQAITTPAAAPVAEAERLLAQLAQARRALGDTDPRADEYTVYLRAVDRAERAVAALEASALRAA